MKPEASKEPKKKGRDPRIFQHWYRGKDGTWQRTRTWYIRYSVHGKPYMEAARTTDYRVAKALLDQRLGEMGLGQCVGPARDRTTLADLARIIETDYVVNNRKSLRTLRGSLKRLRAFFGEQRRARDISLDALNAYVAHRMAEGSAGGTIRNELALLKHAFRLAARAGKAIVPPFPILKEGPPRTGFFEAPEFRAVLGQLPEAVRPIVEFADLTGWRIGEILPLEWRQVDFAAGIVRLEPGTTKNDEGRTFPFAVLPALEALLRRQREQTEARQRATGQIIPWVFHRDGQPVRDFRGAWETACIKAGFFRVEPVRDTEGRPRVRPDGTPLVVKKATRLIHDFRRTAVRNLVRAGVPERVAMQLTGHKTRSVFERYNIVNEADLREGVAKLAAFHARKQEDGEEARRVIALPQGRRGD